MAVNVDRFAMWPSWWLVWCPQNIFFCYFNIFPNIPSFQRSLIGIKIDSWSAWPDIATTKHATWIPMRGIESKVGVSNNKRQSIWFDTSMNLTIVFNCKGSSSISLIGLLSYNVNEFVKFDAICVITWFEREPLSIYPSTCIYLSYLSIYLSLSIYQSFYLSFYQLIKYSFIFKIFPSWDVFSLCSWRCQQSKMADFIWEVCSTSEEELLMQMLYPPHVRLDFGIAKENLTWFETEGVKKACL